ncbi:MAG TPA: hypothetical protein VII38_14520 [Polyangia bacterium]
MRPMSSFQPLAYDPSGSVIAILDGAELFCYRGEDEQPLWRRTAGAPLSAVATRVGEVVTLDESGKLERFEALGGSPLGTLALEAAPRGLAVARDGAIAVLLDDEVALATGGQVARRLPAPGARAIALSADGRSLALGGEASVLVVELQEKSERSTAIEGTIEGAASAISWSARGFFVVAAGERLYRVTASGEATALVKTGARRASELSCSADGGLIACKMAPGEVHVVALPAREVVARLEWDGPISGLAFGPDVWLAVGAGGGEANRIHLQSGEVRRTDPHPGRARAEWKLKTQIDQDKIREARSTANPSAEAVQRKLAAKAEARPVGPRASRVLLYLIVVLAIVGSLVAWLWPGRAH